MGEAAPARSLEPSELGDIRQVLSVLTLAAGLVEIACCPAGSGVLPASHPPNEVGHRPFARHRVRRREPLEGQRHPLVDEWRPLAISCSAVNRPVGARAQASWAHRSWLSTTSSTRK